MALRLAPVLATSLVGGVIAFVLDHFHATRGILWYPRPVFWQQAWWVLPLFVSSALVTLLGARLFRRLVGGPSLAAPSTGAIAGDALAFVSIYAATSFVEGRTGPMALLFAALWLARVLHGGLRPWAIAFCVGTGFAGWGVEAGIQALDGFHYHHPDFGAVPYWLVPLYLYVGLLGVQLERALSDGDDRR